MNNAGNVTTASPLDAFHSSAATRIPFFVHILIIQKRIRARTKKEEMENVFDMCCDLVRLLCVQGAADAHEKERKIRFQREGISKENVFLLRFFFSFLFKYSLGLICDQVSLSDAINTHMIAVMRYICINQHQQPPRERINMNK